jgi:uncharacterized protein YgiM (DUF1202 family)
MKRIIKRYFIAFLIVSIAITAAAAQYVWVSSAGAKLKADKSASSQTLAELPVGAKLSVLALENRWYFVQTSSGEKGWIYRGRISSKPQTAGSQKSGKTDSLGGLLAGATGGSIQADEAATDRSIRGLSPEAREYARRTGTSEQYQKAVDQVLSYKLNEAEIDQFLKNGGIGEYAQ